MRIRQLIQTLILAVVLVGWIQPSYAQSSRVFTIRDLPVDERAATGVAAKETAVAKGGQRALTLVLQRMTQPQDWDLLPQLSAKDVDRLIRNISFADEKVGGGRYLANVTYRFRPPGVRSLLVGSGIAYAESSSRPLVVLPVLESAEGTLFWDEGNQWLKAWADVDVRPGLVPIIAPLGDLSDVAAIGLQQALVGEPEAIKRISSKYRGGGALTVVARPISQSALSIAITGFGRGWNGSTFVETVAPIANEPAEELYRRAAIAVVASTERYWKQANLISSTQTEQRLSVYVPLTDLRQWIAIQDRLSKLVVVRRTDLKELTIQSAELDIHYSGDLVQLRRGLSQQSLALAQDPLYGRWRLEILR